MRVLSSRLTIHTASDEQGRFFYLCDNNVARVGRFRSLAGVFRYQQELERQSKKAWEVITHHEQ
jgi:hypothetical protein